jgi:hypothetical protein
MQTSIHTAVFRGAIKVLQSIRDRFAGNRRNFMRYALAVAVAAGAMIGAPHRSAQQEICSIQREEGCFTPPKRDIAFIVDRSGSIATRGQTYNVEVQGILRALRDPTAIPRDGSIAVSVVTFAEDARVAVPLTEIASTADAESVAAKVQGLICQDISSQTGACPFGGTRYTAAIITADAHLNQNRREGARRVLLMATDGQPDDPDLGVGASESARIAAQLSGLTSELDVILLGLEGAETVAVAKARVDQIVFPKPADDLPGGTLLLQGGECNRPGAAPDSADCNRQANDFADLTRSIIRSDVAPLSMVVTTEDDTEPGARAVPAGPLSLRQAIELANCNGGKATITFADSVKGETINPLVPLPALTAADVTIDGCDGEDCAPWLTIDGSSTDATDGEGHPHGLLVRSGRNTIRGLRIVNFSGAGIAIDRLCPFDSVGRNTVERNVLENNAQAGVLVADTLSEGQESFNVGNTITRNTISNSPTPIDLNDDGPTANDAGDPDLGPNTLLNFADLINIVAVESNVNVTGQVNGPTRAGAVVELFEVTNFEIVEEKLVIEGVSFLADTTTAADGSFSLTGVAPAESGIYTVTVTDVLGNTSEIMAEIGDTVPGRADADVSGTVNFGNVGVNTTPPSRPLDVTNVGNAPLIVTGCSIVRCNTEDRDDTARFTIAGCPTGPVNPGQEVTITVNVSPTQCGMLKACLRLTTNDPKQPIILIELTANVAAPAQARLTLQGGAAALEFPEVTPRGKPRKVKLKNTRTFTIDNLGCDTLNLTLTSIQRTGDAGRLSSTDDRAFFSVSRIGANGIETPITVGSDVALLVGGLQTATFRVRFTPVIPTVVDCPGNPSGLSANEVLPEDVLSRLNITTNAGAPLAVNLIGHVSTGVKLIDPCNPSGPPRVTIARSNNQLTVQFSAFDSNLSINRATYQFLDSAGRQIGETLDVDLTQSIRDRNLVEGQSLTVVEDFTGGGVSSLQINRVLVIVFDGETSQGAISSPITSSAALNIRTSEPGQGRNVRLTPVKMKMTRVKRL